MTSHRVHHNIHYSFLWLRAISAVDIVLLFYVPVSKLHSPWSEFYGSYNSQTFIWRRLPICFIWRESLFTCVPLTRTVNIILDRIYNKNEIESTLFKRNLKNLILDCCSKTTFSFDNQVYEQIDGVSMVCSLGPVLANIILGEFDRTVVSDLISCGTIKYYKRYVVTLFF